MRCLETRATPEGFTRRRREADDGKRHTTIEIPMEVFKQLCAAHQAVHGSKLPSESRDAASDLQRAWRAM